MRGASRASPPSPGHPMRLYYLPSHAFACLTGKYCMFLDLKRDSYFSVPRHAMEELTPWIGNWRLTPCSEARTSTRLSVAAAALASELLAEGMLMEGPETSPDMTRAACAADGDLESMKVADLNARRKKPIWIAAAALLYADWALRILPIARVIDTVCKRKRSRLAAGPMDCERAAYLTTAFLKYRPLFPRDYRCLFDSLALVRFLSRYDLYPDWVFGVQEDPFSAHCWVQAGAVILNDRLDNVAGYTPIMTA